MGIKERAKSKGSLKSQKVTDDSIMGTNNSSIVSKRSVERLYYPDEPHFFRYFVKKPQRRAPLINRGYWLRMKAIDHVVEQFLNSETTKQKVVINLGCGYDPLPWQCWTRYPSASKNVKFVDIDYDDLILKKQKMVQETPALNKMLDNVKYPDEGGVVLRSANYLQMGCDLRELDKLSTLLGSEFELDDSVIFCTAEVSIAYMDVPSSDRLIEFFGRLPEAQFCLLEQIIPQGPDHPFAKTMLAHFDKLGTTLRPVREYQTTEDQANRFRSRGWPKVDARNLWQLWSSDDFLTPQERIAANEVEPFDEWEEFALFGCHYVLLVAHNNSKSKYCKESQAVPPEPIPESLMVELETKSSEISTKAGIKRFAAPLLLRGQNSHPDLIGNFGGHGLNKRLASMDVFSKEDISLSHPRIQMSKGPCDRICHTITDLGEAGSLLVGGRKSPDHALVDCWLYSKMSGTWERVQDLPVPMYRHSAIAIDRGSVLVMAGKSDSKTIVSQCFLWNRQTGWVQCTQEDADGSQPRPQVFGAVIFREDDEGADMMANAFFRSETAGLLSGGITEDGVVSLRPSRWVLERAYEDFEYIPCICWIDTSNFGEMRLNRFGAATTCVRNRIMCVSGGITKDNLIDEEDEIALYQQSRTLQGGSDPCSWVQLHQKYDSHLPRMLFAGHSAIGVDNRIVIMGGGAVCFSMGTFWNTGIRTITVLQQQRFLSLDWVQEQRETAATYQYVETLHAETETSLMPAKSNAADKQTDPNSTTNVASRPLISAEEFESIMQTRRPAVFQSQDLGPCVDSWTNEYILEKIGASRPVVVHKAGTDRMDFVAKNFSYETMTFQDFLSGISNSEKLYLRSLSAEKPTEQAASIYVDFPSIAEDFKFPPALDFVRQNMHSCPLRISGPVKMWLHYDVMANVLCQIRGTKKLLLFPPSDVEYLDFAPGASSSSIDCFSDTPPAEMACAHPHEVIMKPGDILFLPPLWLHTAQPVDGTSISVNVFYKDMKAGYAPGKDVYGNRDLQVYENGRTAIQKLAKGMESLPDQMKKFYLLRLAKELMQKAQAVDTQDELEK